MIGRRSGRSWTVVHPVSPSVTARRRGFIADVLLQINDGQRRGLEVAIQHAAGDGAVGRDVQAWVEAGPVA